MSSAIADVHPPASGSGVADPVFSSVFGDVSRPTARDWPWASLYHLPGEGGLLVGLRTIAGRARRGRAFMVDEHRRFGSVFRSQFGVTPFVGVSDPALILEVLRNEDQAFSAGVAWTNDFRGLDATSGSLDMPFALDFDLHREARTLLQPAFGPTAMASYLDTVLPDFEEAVESWIEGGRVPFKREVRRLFATTSARIFLGVDDAGEGEMLDRALADIWKAPLAIIKDPRFSVAMRRASRAYGALRETLRQRVDVRRARGGDDLFSRLCTGSDGSGWLDDDGLVRLFIGVMVAAFDTTAAATTSMAYLLAKYPRWQERLREEALAIGKERIAYANTTRLEVTDRVWKETLRLFPVAGDVPRATLRGVQLGAWSLPAGVAVLPCLAAAMHDPSWWTDPERFDPDRFSPERTEDRKHKGLFLPFGAGVHAGIGHRLATTKAKALLHAMLTRCRFRLERDYDARHGFRPIGVVSGDVILAVERL
jgi:cytochrome P450